MATHDPAPRSRRTAAFTLFEGDDYERLSELKRAAVGAANIAAASGQSTARGGDEDPVAEADRAYDEFAEEARQRAIEVRLGHLGKTEWRALRSSHPPREGNAVDQELGYDESTFVDAVVLECLVDPTFSSNAKRDEWLQDLSEGETYTLFRLAFGMNEGIPADPKGSGSATRPS